MRGLFFTGTDTGVGKTVVTAAVARALLLQGRSPRVCKPVATGTSGISEDTRQLAAAVHATPEQLTSITRWTFSEPAAPPVAARAAGIRLGLEDVVDAVREAGHEAEILLVEGIGGLLCPLTEKETVADLVRELALPLVVVARRSLGTLNHTLLTVEAALARGLRTVGVVISETTPPASLADETNVEELRRRLPIPILAVVKHGCDDREATQAVARVDWWKLGS
jgi:dethiobiotin synthetase